MNTDEIQVAPGSRYIARQPHSMKRGEWYYILRQFMNIGALPRRCRPEVIRIGTTVRFFLKAPYLGGLTGVRHHLGSFACQAQGPRKLWTMRIWHCNGMILRCCEISGS